MSEVNQAPEAVPAQPIVTPELQPAASVPAVDGGAAVGEEHAAPEGTEPAPQPQPDKRSAQYRFSELTSKARQAEIRAERAEAQLQVYRELGIQPPNQQPRPAPAAQAEGPPDPSGYDLGYTDPEYIADVAAYHGRKGYEDAQAKAAERQEFQTKADRFRGVFTAAEQAAAQNPEEFGLAADVLWNLGNSNDHVTCDLIMESDNHVHLAEWFGRNPGLLQQVQRMAPLQRARAIAQYDFAIGNALKSPAPAPAPAAAAPAPTPAPTPTPIVNGGRTAMAPDLNTASQSEFDAYAQRVWASRQSQGG